MTYIQPLIGIVTIITAAWLIGGRKPIDKKVVLGGLGLQLVFVVLFLKVPLANEVLAAFNQLVILLDEATTTGTSFVFGYLGGGELPFEATSPENVFILAFKALPLVIVVSALSALLFHWRILPWLIGQFSRLLNKSMGISGALGLGAAANIFVGMIEAPLLVRPYLMRLSRGELFALMTSGMATVAGTMMVLYASVLTPVRSDALTHILAASVMSVPAALMIAAIIIPFGDTQTEQQFEIRSEDQGAFDALTRGTLDGVKLLLNILAMLIVFVALVALINMLLELLPDVAGSALTLQRLLGYLFAPLVWLMGIPVDELVFAGSLMGTKTVLNEFLAYLSLISAPEGSLSERSEIIMIYAMCGFANFGSLGIMIGGIGTMAPERRAEVAELGLLSIVAGTFATMLTGTVVGMFY
ncbi:MAG: nucleoside:proton symporter [Gammaproteobacteria bacterium]|nr:nucleoside:proton symporter [Gammaproteobacteria bacterium]